MTVRIVPRKRYFQVLIGLKTNILYVMFANCKTNQYKCSHTVYYWSFGLYFYLSIISNSAQSFHAFWTPKLCFFLSPVCVQIHQSRFHIIIQHILQEVLHDLQFIWHILILDLTFGCPIWWMPRTTTSLAPFACHWSRGTCKFQFFPRGTILKRLGTAAVFNTRFHSSPSRCLQHINPSTWQMSSTCMKHEQP